MTYDVTATGHIYTENKKNFNAIYKNQLKMDHRIKHEL